MYLLTLCDIPMFFTKNVLKQKAKNKLGIITFEHDHRTTHWIDKCFFYVSFLYAMFFIKVGHVCRF
jgi:hypothetical protein